jgi:signal transduction histidine kinase
MLKRIKVRGKLLLLLATPLVAVMVFAFSGIVDRTERTDFQEGEARIAELADSGADLSLAIQIERIQLLTVERSAMDISDLVGDERAATDAELTRWLAAYDNARGDLEDARLIDEYDNLAERLPTTLSPDRGIDAVTGTLLAGASRAVDETTAALASEASDLDLFRALSDLDHLIKVQSSYAAITSIGSEAIFQDQLSAVAMTLITEAERNAQTSTSAFSASADSQYLTSLERLKNSGVLPNPLNGAVDTVGEIRDYIDDASKGGVLAWLERGEAQLRGLNDIVGDLTSDATRTAQQEASMANDEARSFLILAGSVVLLALVMAVIIGRSISRPLTRLTRSAEQLSAEELPALVESMRSAGRAEAPVLTPIEAKGRDEVAQLAHAISEIQQVTIDVADEQSDLLRRGISDIFVNLARRNQSLLDRQIDFIDQLESREENPDQLENLFRLDHLATRMRRNAESLLVLAGAEPTRRRGRPVEIADVLRVAMGEIEDFSRIQLMAVDSSTVAGSVAVDLAHLMSELMENATQFSPPEIDVEVIGYRIADDSYQLTLADKGIGMSAEQIVAANKTLAEPPLVGLDLSRSLGFTVVSRLANRLGITVQLTAGAEGGVSAVVTIPSEMVGHGDGGVDEMAAIDQTAPTMEDVYAPPAVEPGEPVAEPVDESNETPTEPSTSGEPRTNPFLGSPPVLDQPTPTIALLPDPAPEPSSESPVPIVADEGSAKLPTRQPKTPKAAPPEAAPVTEATPPAADSGDLFSAFGDPAGVPTPPPDPEADIFAPIDGGSILPTRTPTTVVGSDPTTEQATPEAAEPLASPVEADNPAPPPVRDPAGVGAMSQQVTSAGLIRRTPKQVDVPAGSKYAPGATPGSPQGAAAAPAATRSPDEVRQMLSRYRAGLRKGRAPEPGTDQDNRRS